MRITAAVIQVLFEGATENGTGGDADTVTAQLAVEF